MAPPSRRQRRRAHSSIALRAGCTVGAAWLLAAVWRQAPAFAGGAAAPNTALARGAHLAAHTRPGPRTALAALEAADLAAAAAGGLDAQLGAAGLETSLLTAFADQGQNINGILFQASLLPYLIFLYFLGYKGNNTPPLVQYAFGFLLTFVISTIPSGIISKSTYGAILADSDWLHGAAESLLTCTNILLVLGFRGGLLGDAALADNGTAKTISGVWLSAALVTIAAGVPLFGWEVHTPFLGGIGALSAEMVVTPEPVNALSVPTWMVHWSTVFEWLLAMSMAWRYADVVGNPRWKGLVWAMLPSHISSCAALTFHVFYNQVAWVLTAQALFTCMGNITLAIAAARIAVSNGWTVDELNPFRGRQEGEKEPAGFDPARLVAPVPASELLPAPLLAVEVVLLTTFFTFATKYGELAIQLFQTSGAEATAAAALLVLLPPALVAYSMYGGSLDLQRGAVPPLLVPAGAASGASVEVGKKA